VTPSAAEIVEAEEMRSRLSIVLLGILVFLLGGVAGAASYYLYCEHQKASVPTTIPQIDDVVDWMARELKLDAQQKASVKIIITETRTCYRDLSQEFRPRYEKMRKESDDRINALLRDDQKPLFEEFLAKIKSIRPAAAQPASTK
jgi:uncharacterized membrane protein